MNNTIFSKAVAIIVVAISLLVAVPVLANSQVNGGKSKVTTSPTNMAPQQATIVSPNVLPTLLLPALL